jgi:hypothetical protein
MPYGTKSALGATAVLPLTGFTLAGWVVAAVTLMFVAIAVRQLLRAAPAQRP